MNIYLLLSSVNCAIALLTVARCLFYIKRNPHDPVVVAPLFGSAAYVFLQADWIASGYTLQVDRVTDLSWLCCELFLLLASYFFTVRRA